MFQLISMTEMLKLKTSQLPHSGCTQRHRLLAKCVFPQLWRHVVKDHCNYTTCTFKYNIRSMQKLVYSVRVWKEKGTKALDPRH